MVAVEQNFPEGQRIIFDGLAYAILPLSARVFVRILQPAWARDWLVRLAEKASPGIYGGMLCRKRYIDEKLLASVNEIGAVVNLGAGFDTRAYRLPELAKVPVWEVDQAENIAAKRFRLLKLFGAVPRHVILVAIDFDHKELGAALSTDGFTIDIPTFFNWEAVTQYLAESAVRATFDFLAKAAKGSRLAFTYIRKDFIDGKTLYGQKNLFKRFVEKRVWVFGMEPEGLADFLSLYGWCLIEDLEYGALAERYVKPTRRNLSSTPIERVALAEKR